MQALAFSSAGFPVRYTISGERASIDQQLQIYPLPYPTLQESKVRTILHCTYETARRQRVKESARGQSGYPQRMNSPPFCKLGRASLGPRGEVKAMGRLGGRWAVGVSYYSAVR
jgi:hypothetical protein